MGLPLAIMAAETGMKASGSILNPILQHNQNIRNQRFQREQYERQRADNLSDWQRENEYNSPQQQMARLKAAGLNPNLVYGNGAVATGASVNSASAQASPGAAPEFRAPDIGNTMSQYQSIQSTQAQTDLLGQQLQNQQAQNELIKAQTLKTIAEIPGSQSSSQMKQILAEYFPDLTRENLRSKQLGNEIQAGEPTRRNQAMANNTLTTLQNILESKARMSKIPLEKQQIEANIRNLNQSELVKALERRTKEQQIITNNLIQEGMEYTNKLRQGQISIQDLQKVQMETQQRFKQMGLSESVTSDLIKMIFGSFTK